MWQLHHKLAYLEASSSTIFFVPALWLVHGSCDSENSPICDMLSLKTTRLSFYLSLFALNRCHQCPFKIRLEGTIGWFICLFVTLAALPSLSLSVSPWDLHPSCFAHPKRSPTLLLYTVVPGLSPFSMDLLSDPFCLPLLSFSVSLPAEQDNKSQRSVWSAAAHYRGT